MTRAYRIMQNRSSVLVIGLAILLVLGAVGGVAWAFGTGKGKSFQIAETYHLVLTPTQQQDDTESVEWHVGQATINATVGAAYSDPNNPGRISMGWGAGVMNEGAGPIQVVSPHGQSNLVEPFNTAYWLDEGESVDAGPGPGQSVNETNYPGPVGGVQVFAIIDSDGVSVSGTFAYSSWVDDADQTAHAVLSLQMRG